MNCFWNQDIFFFCFFLVLLGDVLRKDKSFEVGLNCFDDIKWWGVLPLLVFSDVIFFNYHINPLTKLDT